MYLLTLYTNKFLKIMKSKSKVIPFKEIKLDEFSDKRGTICVLNKSKQYNFEIKRIYFFQNKKNDIIRGFHSQKKNHCIFVPVYGKFKIKLNFKDKTYNRVISAASKKAIYIGPGVWREILTVNKTFSCFIINSKFYDKKDYNFVK